MFRFGPIVVGGAKVWLPRTDHRNVISIKKIILFFLAGRGRAKVLKNQKH